MCDCGWKVSQLKCYGNALSMCSHQLTKREEISRAIIYLLSHITFVASSHQTCSIPKISQLLFCRMLEASSFNSTPDLTVRAPGGSMAGTRETSRFGEIPMSQPPVHLRSVREKNLEYVQRAPGRLQSWRQDRLERHHKLNAHFSSVHYQIHQQVFQSHPQPTKVMKTTLIVEPFLTDLFKNHIVMKPINITTWTKRIPFQTHHPPRRCGLQDQTGHDKVIGRVVGNVVGSHHKIRGQRYQHNLQWLNF